MKILKLNLLLSFFSVPAGIFLPPPKVHRLSLGERNVSFICFGQGYPMPSIVWKKDGNLTEYPIVTTNLSAINSSKRLEIRSDGVTYQEAGNYTCEVYNGADGLAAVFDTLEVICEYFPNLVTTVSIVRYLRWQISTLTFPSRFPVHVLAS